MKTIDVIGLGHAIVDLLVEVDEDKLLEFNLKKGSFELVDETKAHEMLEKIKKHELKITKIPGGSSANTIKGVAFLGGDVMFCGRVGNDEHADIYVQEMHNHQVQMKKHTLNQKTGHALTFITPDSERTFSVHLGASVALEKEHVLEQDIAKSKVLHLEGYQTEGPTKEMIEYAIDVAKKQDTLVSIDLADPMLIERNLEYLKKLVLEHADIVFVNETEAKAFTGLQEEAAAREIAKHAQIAIVKLGKEGSLICKGDTVVKVKSFEAKAIDTTGAGDSYAAGFLYGYTHGFPLEKCGELGSYLAARVVEKIGVRIKDIDVNEVKAILQ